MGSRRIALVLLAAAAFGVVMSVLKGSGGGVLADRPVRGALVGLLASPAGLAGFYLANMVVLGLGAHPLLALGSGRRFFALALLSGPLLGALGGLRSSRLAVLVAALLLLEPLAWLVHDHGHPASGDVVAWAIEVALGATVLALRRASLLRRVLE
jgi:hypothetical protein